MVFVNAPQLIAARSKPASLSHSGWIEPCLATEVARPPVGARWVHEIKRDGYRTQLHRHKDKITLYSSAGFDWTDRYGSIAEALSELPAKQVVIDAEMTVPYGHCYRDDFWTLQADVARRRADRLIAHCFDIMILDGEDLRDLPFTERKKILAELLAAGTSEKLRYSEHMEEDGPELYAKAQALGLEGVVSKVADAPYRSGRSNAWLKTICQYRETLPIIGVKVDKGAFAGLYLGRMQSGKLVYAGKVERGFTDDTTAELMVHVERRSVKRCVLQSPPDKPKARWLEQGLTADVIHRGGLQVGRVRHAVFNGLNEERQSRARPLATATASVSVARENILQLLPNATVPSVAQLKAHWRKVGREALAHLGNRPLKFVRHFEGTTYYHMGPLPPVPPSVHQLKIRKANGQPGIRLWVDSVEGLLGLVDMGIIEVHPWAATVADIERPDMLVFDLDPGKGIEWSFVVDTALRLRQMLKDEGFSSWPKLTGGKGLHLMVPIEPQLTHRQVHEYSKALAIRLAATDPRRYTIVPGEDERVGKLFIDYLRNGRGCTAIGCYSPRAREGLRFAAPVTWQDVQRRLTANAFTLSASPKKRPPRSK